MLAVILLTFKSELPINVPVVSVCKTSLEPLIILSTNGACELGVSIDADVCGIIMFNVFKPTVN